MSALPPKADMLIVGINVRYVPLADIGAEAKVASTRSSFPVQIWVFHFMSGARKGYSAALAAL